jgi:hypothetical protein
LLGPKTKFERAKEHFDQLHAEMAAFHKRDPYLVIGQDDPATGDKVFRVTVIEEPPPRFAAMVGDTVHNLRSALDLLAWQLVEAGGGTPGDTTMFPIRKSKKAFETAGLAQVEGASEEAIRILKELKPYKGENDALWRLNRLDANDKHRLLVVLGSAYQSVIISMKDFLLPDMEMDDPVPELHLKPADRLFPLVDGAEVFRIAQAARGTPMDENPKFAFHIAISDGEVVHGEPLIPVLNDLGNAVKATLDLFVPLL